MRKIVIWRNGIEAYELAFGDAVQPDYETLSDFMTARPDIYAVEVYDTVTCRSIARMALEGTWFPEWRGEEFPDTPFFPKPREERKRSPIGQAMELFK